MKFEEALAALREGAKIWHPGMPEDEYYIACRVSLILNETFTEDMSLISIAHMKSDKIHPVMNFRLQFDEHMDLLEKYPLLKDKIIFPTINLLLLMSDDWEIIGGIK